MHRLLAVFAVLATAVTIVRAEPTTKTSATMDDPTGILRRPIPDKLVALTFDDSPASHATIVAPILKSLGFGGSFYICDFDSFRTRKDWYLTWRQMKAMADDGFEIGNHTLGHGGGLNNYLSLEDELLANGVPKPTTVCWPVYQAWPSIYGDLAAHGYLFGRGGHDRAYRPTVDNPFDIPSFTLRDGVPIETFIKQVQLARQGRIVVLTFHGVPDMEHPSVGLEPATFKAMMQYLKDNHYQCIALRDLANYIDPAKAAKLPQTENNAKVSDPSTSVQDEKPVVVVANDIKNFSFPGLPPVSISKTDIRATVPYATDVTALSPNITVSADATLAPASGIRRDFTTPQTYTVTGQDGSTKTYTVTVSKMAVSTAKNVLSFVLPGANSVAISGHTIGVYVPPATDVKTLAPTFTLSPFATAVPASGTARDFSKPQTYTITAQDGSTQVYTVTVVKSDKPNSFTWSKAESGNWSEAAKWTNPQGAGVAPNAAGQSDCILNFNLVGDYAVTNDLSEGFQLNQLNLGPTKGFKWAGKGISFTTNRATGNLPGINVNTMSESDKITLPMNLAADVNVKLIPHGRMTIEGLISGTGGLILDCPGTDGEHYNNWGYVRIDNKTNTYSGGTIINSGQLFLFVAPQGLGTGPVTLNQDGDIRVESVNDISNPLILNGGTIEGGGSWNAPITLNGNAKIAGHFNLNDKRGGISGPGGLTQIGPIGAFGRVNGGVVSLWGVNTYTGPTTVHLGTLVLKKAVSLYNADMRSWTAAKISVHPAATLTLCAGGPGEFTGAQIDTLLTNLTASVQDNGLLARSTFCVDTANATETVVVSADITDSKGPGGGAFIIQKRATGTLRLAGNNTYTGQTILEGGALSVASLNSVVGGKPSSSLGAPRDVEAGEIVLGRDGQDGECALIYTGTGEITDRVINLFGKKATATFDHSGSGLWKFTSPFALSGYGADKTLVLKGDTSGTGEIAGNLNNPYDRAGKATTAVAKSGAGTWILSGANGFTGPTTVAQGTLTIATAHSLGENGEVNIADGATLDLNFSGTIRVRKLTLGGKPQPAGAYDTANTSKFLKGSGILNVQP